MKVHGIEFSEIIIWAADAVLDSGRPFCFEDVRSALCRAIPEGFDFNIQHKESVIDRLTDRVLQRAKREGRIRYIGKRLWEQQTSERVGSANVPTRG
jgi:hypothetical protein